MSSAYEGLADRTLARAVMAFVRVRCALVRAG
jgi:hypothetical protein